jgi:hypothetical protein
VIEQKLRPLRTQLVLREESDAIAEVIKGKPHLAEAADVIKLAWRQSGNTPLNEIVSKVEKIYVQGRNISKEAEVVQKQNQVETGRGAGEVTISSSAKRNDALRSGSIEAIAATLPDDLGVR